MALTLPFRAMAQRFIPTNEINCRLHSVTSERIGNPELKAAIKCVHEYNRRGRIFSGPGFITERKAEAVRGLPASVCREDGQNASVQSTHGVEQL